MNGNRTLGAFNYVHVQLAVIARVLSYERVLRQHSNHESPKGIPHAFYFDLDFKRSCVLPLTNVVAAIAQRP